MAEITAKSLRQDYLPIPEKRDKGYIQTATHAPAALVVGLGQAVISAGYVAFSSSQGRTFLESILESFSGLKKRRFGISRDIESRTDIIDRHNYDKLWSLQLGDYFMPLSQTFKLRAKKHLNVSSLVDGIDIIQQTRKEAKTVDCNLRLTLRSTQPNLMIEHVEGGFYNNTDPDDGVVYDGNTEDAAIAIDNINTFLSELYENDAVFIIKNKMINETFGVEYVFMSDYEFEPRVGMGTFDFKFSLTEVIYGDNVLTFSANQINGD